MANAYRSVLQDAKPTGNALPADVLAGKTFSNADGVDKTGTMVNNGAVTITLTDQDPSYTVPEGYHNGSGTVSFTPSGGDGADLVVTCSDVFAGATISCTDGTTTFTEICPSTSPYVVTFESIPTGTWTVSGVVEGTTYSQQVVITDFDVTLTAGFDYKQWVTLGGLDPADYTDLEDVFADEVAVRRLMTIHASADYLIEKVTDDIDTIDDFTANDTAMKWIGLRDYVCDGLTAIAGVEAKFMASQYWERYLKDHVPVMTSNTAPYGTASAYQVFDGSSSTSSSATSFSYKFTNPICVKRFECSASGGTLSGSNDGSTYTTISNPSENTDYYLYYKVTFSASTSVNTLQFYGRSLDESVPVMTSDKAPYGTVVHSSVYNAYYAWHPFSNTLSNTTYTEANSFYSVEAGTKYVGYIFDKKIRIRRLAAKVAHGAGNITKTYSFYFQYTDDGESWKDIPNSTKQVTTNSDAYSSLQLVDCDIEAVGIRVISFDPDTAINIVIGYLQFYGVDYSEREFETGSTKKWLYDHGVELETLDYSNKSSGNVLSNTNDSLLVTQTLSNGFSALTVDSSVDFTDYNYCMMRVGDEVVSTNANRIFQNKPTSSGGGIATALITLPLLHLISTVDVSSINEPVYPSIYSGSSNTKIKITEWWLE